MFIARLAPNVRANIFYQIENMNSDSYYGKKYNTTGTELS